MIAQLGPSDVALRLSARLCLSSCRLSSLSLSPSPGPHACAACAGDSVVSQPGLSSTLLLIFSATHKALPGTALLHTSALPTLFFFFFEGPHFTQVFDFSPPFFSSVY